MTDETGNGDEIRGGFTTMNGGRTTLLVTGAAGFIGSNLVRHLLATDADTEVVALDALTYSGSLSTLADMLDDPRLTFVHGDIRDRELIRGLFEAHRPAGLMHLAAESHVDRSIVDPLLFVETNVVGTVVLLQEATKAWGSDGGRFLHVSTDEVFGQLGATGYFNEETPYAPNSPYSASKASSDHFVRAWGESYGLDYVITNCTNNYGPYQFPEKLIPMTITRAISGQRVPVYGQGGNVRDWLYVEDHCRALKLAYERGRADATYAIGGEAESANLDLVNMVLEIIDEQVGAQPGTSTRLVEFVGDRPGHDFRYAMDIRRIREELGWAPSMPLREGLTRTVGWYLANLDWVKAIESEEHLEFQSSWYGDRVGDGQS
jgi:dTDP-glucose 4,6-dehydratase